MSVHAEAVPDRWPPKRNEMPDLSSLSSNLVGAYYLNYIFRDAGFQTPDDRGRAYFINLVRLVDKTLREYEEARKYLQDYVQSTNKTRWLLRSTDHMENCIESLHRLFKHIKGLRDRLHKLRKNEEIPVPKIDWGKIPKDKDVRRVRQIRDAIQHMDEKIIKGSAGPGSGYIGLHVMSDSIELISDNIEPGAQVIYHSDLASWIREVHEVAQQLVMYEAS